jgi:Glycosyl hydrolases family 39.
MVFFNYRKFLPVLFCIAGAGFIGVNVFAAVYTITVDGSIRQGDVPHFWSECVGTGTMSFCLKPQWQAAAKIGAQEAGFKRVRGHGILMRWNGTDDVGIFHWNGTGSPTYTWSKLDSIYDFIKSCNMQPLVELSFMPHDLQTNGVTSKPKNWNVWRDLIDSVVAHCVARYGAKEVESWYWEVWNEYDYPGFWSGTVNDYDTLYSKAVEGAKLADSLILIGGPVTTGPGPLQAFLDYCTANHLKVDFLSCHGYGNAPGNTSDPVNIRDNNWARAQVIKNSGKKLFSINSEYNSTYAGSGGQQYPNVLSMDSHVNAPFVTKSVKLILDDYTSGQYALPDVLSYWTISDAFDESGATLGSYIEQHNSVPFGNVFGLINYQGLRKATFNGFKMLHMMGVTRCSLTGGTGDADGVDGFATMSKDSTQMAVLLYSYYKDFTVGGVDNTVNLTINHMPFQNGQLTIRHYQVDSTHSNPYSVWLKQGKPTTPTTAQMDSLKAAQDLAEAEPASQFNFTGAAFTKTLTLPAQSVVLLTIGKTTSDILPPDARSAGNGYLAMHGTMFSAPAHQGGPVDVLVYSTGGRLVRNYRVSQQSMDLAKGLSTGVYLVHAEAPGLHMVKKMMVH